jgi:hypothetical protein
MAPKTALRVSDVNYILTQAMMAATYISKKQWLNAAIYLSRVEGRANKLEKIAEKMIPP